jgi:hypothetical protein
LKETGANTTSPLLRGCLVYRMLILSPNGRIPWRKRINAREGDPSRFLMLS